MTFNFGSLSGVVRVPLLSVCVNMKMEDAVVTASTDISHVFESREEGRHSPMLKEGERLLLSFWW